MTDRFNCVTNSSGRSRSLRQIFIDSAQTRFEKLQQQSTSLHVISVRKKKTRLNGKVMLRYKYNNKIRGKESKHSFKFIIKSNAMANTK